MASYWRRCGATVAAVIGLGLMAPQACAEGASTSTASVGVPEKAISPDPASTTRQMPEQREAARRVCRYLEPLRDTERYRNKTRCLVQSLA